MQGIQMQVGRLPITITFYPNGCVSFDRMANFPLIADQPEVGVQAIISVVDIAVGAQTVIDYGETYELQCEPELKAWLKAQNLQPPF